MGRFHITIFDNEEQKELVNADADVIIGAHQDGQGTGQLCFAACDDIELIAGYCGASAVLRLLRENNPKIAAFDALGIVNKVVGESIDESKKNWYQMTVSTPKFRGEEDE